MPYQPLLSQSPKSRQGPRWQLACTSDLETSYPIIPHHPRRGLHCFFSILSFPCCTPLSTDAIDPLPTPPRLTSPRLWPSGSGFWPFLGFSGGTFLLCLCFAARCALSLARSFSPHPIHSSALLTCVAFPSPLPHPPPHLSPPQKNTSLSSCRCYCHRRQLLVECSHFLLNHPPPSIHSGSFAGAH